MQIIRRLSKKRQFSFLLGIMLSCTLLADDIDVYNTSNALPYPPYEATGSVAPPNPNYPNILFVLDASASMIEYDGGQVGTRIDRLRAAMRTVLENTSNVNIAVMRFSSRHSGGRIVYPMSPIEFARDDVIDAIDNIELEFYTPTIGALLESAFYFRGDAVFYGTTRTREIGNRKHFAERFMRLSHPESYDGGYIVREGSCTEDNLDNEDCITERIYGEPKYKSPILSGCQGNYQVVLSDGAATNAVDIAAGNSIVSIVGLSDAYSLGVEVVRHLATTDQSLTVPGTNTVITHTVGFNTNQDLLRRIAEAGNGEYFQSGSADQLAISLTNIIEGASGPPRTLAQPAVSIDPSGLAHRKDVYIPLIQPAQRAVWPGNLKGYWLDGELKDYSDPRITAIDPDSGAIANDAKSKWSQLPDGSMVQSGGAASKIRSEPHRIIVTKNPGNSSPLLDDVNHLTIDNVTAADLGLPDNSLSLTVQDRDSIVQWARGVDVKDENSNGITIEDRQQYGDPLHTNPLVATYGIDDESGEYDSVVFFGTNDGFLNAVDTVTGEDLFSFIPWSLMENLKHGYADLPYARKLYGMDGYLSHWFDDSNNNGFIDEANDHFYLYAGMRRGGRNYYALDVTKKSAPELLWSIEGGTGSFTELGQSWSKLQPAKIKHPVSGEVTEVLVFSGGYDEKHDDELRRVSAETGRSINIIDATTGELIWQAGPAGSSLELKDMKYSIPATPTVMDVDGDGLLDQIYAADLGGQIWRFDFMQDGAVDGGVIASLSTNDVDNKLFFSSPDVALIKPEDEEAMISVSIGSGSRHLPLDITREHKFYVIMQKDVYNAPVGYGAKQPDGSYLPITHEDLVDITEKDSALNIADIRSEISEKYGWYLDLEERGEKVVNASITVDHKVLFTSYVPGEIGLCNTGLGSNNLYLLNIFDGSPVVDQDDDGTLVASDRKQQLLTQGISAPPSVFFPGDDKLQIMVGTEAVGELETTFMQRIYWSEVPDY